jgi:hypothetical protein
VAPASPIWLFCRLQRGEEGQRCLWRDRAAGTERARATYLSDVSVALLLSASESTEAPASSIPAQHRLQRGEKGQGCSVRDRATEQGAHDLLERRQQAQCIHKLGAIPPAFELLKHNFYGVHLSTAPTLL